MFVHIYRLTTMIIVTLPSERDKLGSQPVDRMYYSMLLFALQIEATQLIRDKPPPNSRPGYAVTTFRHLLLRLSDCLPGILMLHQRVWLPIFL